MFAVSPSSAALWCFSSCLIEVSFDVFGSLPGSLLRLAGGTGGMWLDIMECPRSTTIGMGGARLAAGSPIYSTSAADSWNEPARSAYPPTGRAAGRWPSALCPSRDHLFHAVRQQHDEIWPHFRDARQPYCVRPSPWESCITRADGPAGATSPPTSWTTFHS